VKFQVEKAYWCVYSGGNTVDDRSITVIEEGMVGGDLSQEGKRTYLVSEGMPTARVSTRFHFQSQGHTVRGDDG